MPWIFDVIGKAEALVVRPRQRDHHRSPISPARRSPRRSPRPVTTACWRRSHDAGVAESDVNIIDSEPDAIYAAWQQGDIDGAYVWNPNLAKLVAEGGTVLVTSEDLAEKGKTTYDLAIVTNEFADEPTRQPCRSGSSSRTQPSRRSATIRTRPPRRWPPS